MPWIVFCYKNLKKNKYDLDFRLTIQTMLGVSREDDQVQYLVLYIHWNGSLSINSLFFLKQMYDFKHIISMEIKIKLDFPILCLDTELLIMTLKWVHVEMSCAENCTCDFQLS